LLDASGDAIAILDDITTFSWDRRLAEVDTFSMSIPSTSSQIPLITTDTTVLAPDDPPIAYTVENIGVTIRGAESVMDASGRSIDSIFGSPGRHVIPPVGEEFDTYDVLPVETIMKSLVNNHAGPGASVNRRVSDLVIASDLARGSLQTVHARYESILEWLERLAEVDYMGWEIAYDLETGQHTFDVIVGDDVADEVILDTAFDSIDNMEWFRTSADYASYAIVGGAGEGITRTIIEGYPDVEPTGFARKEIFVDAGSVSDVLALALEGDAALGEASRQESFRIQIANNSPFRYREHWDLGDIVTVRNARWGVMTAAKIVAVSASIESASLRPIFSVEIGKPAPALARRITKEMRRQANQRGNQ
jgi:hypothetical protein